MISVKTCIKVPLVLIENFTFLLFPELRPFIEKYLYNPLDFKQQHIEYSRKKYQEFRVHVKNSLAGKTLLELGPGGSLGFGLLALEENLQKYVAIDDGLHTFISDSQLLHYKALLHNGPSSIENYFTKAHKGWLYRPEKIESLTINQSSTYPLPNNSVDYIYSCAVLEHVHNLDLCFAEMQRVLRPGGIMYHEVDLRDHIFSQKSLWFLTISDFWFRILFSRTGGYVNRHRLSTYKALAQKYSFQIQKIVVTECYTGPSFPTKLADLSPEDRNTLSIIITLQKNNE